MVSMNLLFIHEIEYQTKVVYEVHEFPEQLAARGHGITFIDFPETQQVTNFNKSMRERVIQGRVLKHVKLRLLTPFVAGPPPFDRLLATLTFIPLLIGTLRKQKFDVIVLYAVPTFGWQTVLIAKAMGVPVLYRALDVSHKIRESAFARPIKLAERFIYHRVDRISANNPAMRRYCESLGERVLPSEVNLPPLDSSHFGQHSNTEGVTRKQFGIDAENQVIMYMGTFFYFSGLEDVIRGFHKQKLQNRNFKLVLVGGGEQDDFLRQLVVELQLQEFVIFTGFVDYKVLHQYLQLADLFINPMKPDLVSNTAFPHKVLQYMASGKPVISTKLSGLFETFGEGSGIEWVDQPNEIIDACILLSQNGQTVKANVELQKHAVNVLLDMDKCLDGFTQTLIRTKQGGIS